LTPIGAATTTDQNGSVERGLVGGPPPDDGCPTMYDDPTQDPRMRA
jgi:hypothetical protein